MKNKNRHKLIQSKSTGNRTIADNKMATSTSLAAELMQTLTPEAYCEQIDALSSDSAISTKVMQSIKSTLKNNYEFNSEIFRARNGTPKPTGMLELFGKYSGEDALEICKRMINYAREHQETLSTICKHVLDYQKLTLKAWMAKHSLKKAVCDEISLYVLCNIYSRHAIVYTAKNIWTTLCHDNLSASEVESRCDLIFNHTDKGLVLCIRLNKSVEEQGTPDNVKRKRRTTTSIHNLLEVNKERAREKQNKVSAKLSVSNILPDDRTHNTRHTTPLHRRQNIRDQRNSYENKNYSDNLDVHHLDLPPNKRTK